MKKFIFIILGVIVVGVAIGGGYAFYRKSSKVKSPVSVVQPTPQQEEMTQWVDQSEYRFQYPKSLTLNPHDEDKINYSHVELTSATHSGNLIVWVKDTTQTTMDDWLKKNKITASIDSNLGGVPAKKYFDGEDQKKVITTAIRDGFLYQVEVDTSADEYWNTVGAIATSTFAYVTPTKGTEEVSQTNTASDESGSTEAAAEGEFIGEETVE